MYANDSRHVIVKQTPEGRVRLRGIFTDEQFAKLPLVRSFGAFPSGIWACHYGESHTTIRDQILALPESPVSAEVELALLERVARRARYVVEVGEARPWYFSSVKAANAKAEQIVSEWRGYRGPFGGYSNTAVKLVSYRDQPNEPGKTILRWDLKRSHRSVKTLRVRRLDARGALAYADAYNRREVA